MVKTNAEFFSELDKTRSDISKVITFYDDTAANYNQLFHDSGYTDTTDYCASLLKDHLGDVTKDVLDVGCGTGKTGASLKKSGFENIDGVDPSVASLKVSKESGSYRNVFEGKITDTEKLNCEDESYDGILCLGCFTVGHIELNDGIPEFIRVLRNNGVAVYTISFTLDKAVALEKHIPFLSRKEIELLKIEKKFYHFIDGKPMSCHIYVVKKL